MLQPNSELAIRRCIISGFVCALLFVLFNSLLYIERFENIGMEDGVAENIGAVSFLLTSGLFFLLFLKTKRSGVLIRSEEGLGAWFWYLILAVLFFFVTGEEISWGQRIFGWATPDWLKDNNVQEETTIHNIEIFNAHTKEHELKPFWQSLITMNRLFSLFWLAWCFGMPLVMAYSAKIRQIVAWFRVPVPRFVHGCMFLCTYIAAKLFVIILRPEELIVEQLDEIKECFYAVIFLMVAWDFYQRWQKRDATEKSFVRPKR